MTGRAVVRCAGDRTVGRQRSSWIAVASETVAHAQRHLLRDDLHRLDWAVTRLAEDARNDMWTMVEVDVIRQQIDALPRDGLGCGLRIGDLPNRRTVGLWHAVTVHADIDWWHRRVARAPDRAVAVLAGDLQGARVKAMRIRNRLRWGIATDEAIRLREPADKRDRCGHRDRSDWQPETRELVEWRQHETRQVLGRRTLRSGYLLGLARSVRRGVEVTTIAARHRPVNASMAVTAARPMTVFAFGAARARSAGGVAVRSRRPGLEKEGLTARATDNRV